MARRYPFLHFPPGVDWKEVDPKLLAGLNSLGRDRGEIVTVTSGRRSFEEQAALYERYKRSGFDIRYIAAKPGHSEHESGGAADATIGGKSLASVVRAKELARHGLVAPVKGDLVHIQLLNGAAPVASTDRSPAPATNSAAPEGDDGDTGATITPPYAVPPPTALGVSAVGPELPGSQNYTLDPRQVSETWSSLAADPFASDETKQWAQRAMLAAGG